MKSLALLSFSFCLLTVSHADARSMRTVLERKMPADHCDAAIAAYAHMNGLKREAIGNLDYLLLDSEGDRVGNAYLSQGTCYIYRDL